MGMQVKPDARIEVTKQAQGRSRPTRSQFCINKPLGMVSGQAEDGHEPAIKLVQPQNRWADDNARFFFHPSQLKSLVPAGRLDIDSTGLLGADARRPRGAPVDWRRCGDGKRIPGARGLHRCSQSGGRHTRPQPLMAARALQRQRQQRAPGHRLHRSNSAALTMTTLSAPTCNRSSPRPSWRAAAPRPAPGWPGPQTRQGGMAKPRATALCAGRGQETPDPAHV
jgi:hypothetical protein